MKELSNISQTYIFTSYFYGKTGLTHFSFAWIRANLDGEDQLSIFHWQANILKVNACFIEISINQKFIKEVDSASPSCPKISNWTFKQNVRDEE